VLQRLTYEERDSLLIRLLLATAEQSR
jgi:hypothetical protein